MRKQVLLTLILVGALCSFASATQGTSLDPVMSGWVDTNGNNKVDISDWILIDLVYSGPDIMLAWNVVVETTGIGTADYAGVTDTGWAEASYHMPPIISGNTLELADANFGGINPGTIYTEIWIHCDGAGPVTVMLREGVAAGGSYDVTGSSYLGDYGYIVIEQVPEPMTLTLLGLGGLALIRRRK